MACVLGAKIKIVRQYTMNRRTTCKACGVCLKIGCPAIEVGDSDPDDPKLRKTRINPVLCVGCGMCVQLCKFGAIGEV